MPENLLSGLDFNPRPPRGGRHHPHNNDRQKDIISIHAPREGGDIVIHILSRSQIISIHAPREGGDQTAKDADAATDISIHAPREGGDPKISKPTANSGKFQSTPPARGATFVYGCSAYFSGHFNPRPPRGGRPGWITGTASGLGISIHAPREGGDFCCFCSDFQIDSFQSTPPARGATLIGCIIGQLSSYFNPRPPRGGRRDVTSKEEKEKLISIHAPREGGDPKD